MLKNKRIPTINDVIEVEVKAEDGRKKVERPIRRLIIIGDYESHVLSLDLETNRKVSYIKNDLRREAIKYRFLN